MHIIISIFKYIFLCLGFATFLIIVVTLVANIYKHFKMKKIIKEYAEALEKNNFLKDALGPMTEDEKNRMKKDHRAKTEVSMDFGTMKVKKESK